MPTPTESAVEHLQNQRFAQAEAVLRRALQRAPGDADANRLMGVAQGRLGRIEQARFYFQRALAAAPSDSLISLNFGNVLLAAGRSEEAVPLLRRATELNPNSFEAWNSLCGASTHQALFDDAIAAGERATALAPEHPSAWLNLGSCLGASGDVRSSLAALQRGLAVAPDDPSLIGTYLMATNYDPARTATERFEVHRAMGSRLAALAPSPLNQWPNKRNRDKRLRVGYLSFDLRQHVVAVFLEALLRHRDRAGFEVLAYHTGPMDGVSERLRGMVDRWAHAEAMNDEQIVSRIRADRVDILVDLGGHTDGSRPGVLATRAAPVQATYMAYPNTTGLPTMDYRIVDEVTDPAGAEALATERLVRLPRCFLAYTAPEDAPEVGPMLPGVIRFGSFNAAPKINEQTLELWARVLLAAPGSQLIIKNRGLSCGRTRRRWSSVLESAGVRSDRVALRTWEPSPRHHLEAYERVHIALDTFPYHGTTTTCEALWMGVPVLTLAGDSHVSRVGASLLSAVGLPELIASGPEDFVDRAVGLASNTARLAALRGQLRQRVRGSPLCDGAALSRAIERAYREMWRAWCGAQPA